MGNSFGKVLETCCGAEKPLRQGREQSPEPHSIQPHLVQSQGRLPIVAQQRSMLKPEDFKQSKILGVSAFGSVVLVNRKRGTQENTYAMKRIDKSKIKEKNLLQSEYIQKVILASRNAFLVDILYTFQTDRTIFVVMQYIEKGDLYYYLKYSDFTQDTIRLIVAEVIQGITFLHSKNIIYRYLKPQNILVTNEGHIKLTDFGLSRLQIQNKKAYTFSGSLQYLAPEIIDQKTGYDKSADLWALGVLLYQMKRKITPFFSENQAEIKDKICSVDYQFDFECSQDYRDLIKKLLVKQPTRRIPLELIRLHPFFQKIDWNEVKQRKNEAPLKLIMQTEKGVDIKYRDLKDAAKRMYINYGTANRNYSPTLYQFTCESSESGALENFANKT